MKNVIPDMIHPLGKHWHQPNLDNILIDDTHALMSECSFKELGEYSCSIPTGVYEGKMWKAYNKIPDIWFLRWYDHIEGKYMTIGIREIIICGYNNECKTN